MFLQNHPQMSGRSAPLPPRRDFAAYAQAGQYALGLVILAAIFALALSKARFGVQVLPFQDKYEHVLAFSVLAFCVGLGAPLRKVCAIALLLTGCAFAIEWAQANFTTTREAHLDDALASMAGAGLGLTLAWLIGLKRATRLQREY